MNVLSTSGDDAQPNPASSLADDQSAERQPALSDAAISAVPAAEPLRSVHTSNFPLILDELGISLLVSTYQAGKLVALRADGGVLNTHFRIFNKPMGLAVHGGRLAIGTAREIWEYHDLPAVAHKLEPVGKHDAAYLPRTCHVTGDIQIHEMAYATSQETRVESQEPEKSRERRAESREPEKNTRGSNNLALDSRPSTLDSLWFVNTAFSCLCTRSDIYSFQPRWRPWFVKELVPADRCHLNGLALRDGQPRYVTALGETNENAGWRANKRDGGLLIDIQSNEIIARGLSMPHSPRWYDGRLWVLNSGDGGFGTIDLATGRYEEVTQLPGFTRGLSFCGPLAFIGLSQVRESAVFSGIAIAERALAERNCGVWVVDLGSGEPIAFVKFEDAVQEIFAVEVLLGTRYPDVVNEDQVRLDSSFELPDDAMADVPEQLRASAVRSPQADPTN